MMPIAALSAIWHGKYPIACSSSRSLDHIACAIFREIIILIQYAVVLASIAWRRWCWISTAIPRKYLKVHCFNIGSLHALVKCLAVAWRPFPKKRYEKMGRLRGLRITHDIIYRPASGLCLGISLSFLAEFLLSKNPDIQANLLAATRIFRWGGNETSVRVQALYDALIGMQGTIKSEEKEELCRLLRGDVIFPRYSPLVASIETFKLVKDDSKPLRQFILDDLESRGIDITSDVYALILEIEATWNLHNVEKKYDAIHHAILQTVAEEVGLELMSSTRLQGEIERIEKELMKLFPGSYLIQFLDHTIVLAKTENLLAFLDPKEGLALLAIDQQREGLSHMLKHYGSHHLVALKVIAIRRKI